MSQYTVEDIAAYIRRSWGKAGLLEAVLEICDGNMEIPPAVVVAEVPEEETAPPDPENAAVEGGDVPAPAPVPSSATGFLGRLLRGE